jgi:hypothetical protein
MNTQPHANTGRYAKVIEISKRIGWDIDRDVIRGRQLDFSKKFLPDGLSKISELDFLDARQQRFLSHIQGRTYANMFGLVERFIGAKMLEVSRDHWIGDQTALEALVRFTDEELKHQELFRRIERMVAEGMPPGYTFVPQPNEVATAVLGKSTWAVLGLTCHIELFSQAHYRESIEADAELSSFFKDIFRFHWIEESQHAIVDELEWVREDGKLSASERDRAVKDLIDLVAAVDGLLQLQAKADAAYFLKLEPFTGVQAERIGETLLRAYRWQYIVSGVKEPRFNEILGRLISEQQGKTIGEALQPILQ